MAELRQQLSSLLRCRALALLHLVCLLFPPSGVLSRDNNTHPSPLEGFELLKGNFSRTFLRVGYHKITEIPLGARNIIIQETLKSRNYLALQTRTGVSILNGNWVIDRPGVFDAVGTQLTYRRPNEIRSRKGESITAPGPLTEELHVYLIYQQPSPSVYYEYDVPLENTQPTSEPTASSNINQLGTVKPSNPSEKDDITDNDITKDTPSTNQITPEPIATTPPQPTYTWAMGGHTECSRSCGNGSRHLLWDCVNRDTQVKVSDDLCDETLRPSTKTEDCNTQACPAYWDVGEWSDCSTKCGPGTQLRQVICRQVTRVHSNGTESSITVAPELCGSTEKPATASTCQLKICSQWEIQSEWSSCSVPCGVGQRHRDVSCVSNQGDVEKDEECNKNLKPDTLQNCDMGACARSWFTSLWSQGCSAECGKGNKTRTVVCLMDHVTDLPLDSCEGERPAEVTSCDSGPCRNQFEWYTGPWGQCSAQCGNGTQTRNLVCMLNNNGHLVVVDKSKCLSLPQPMTTQTCSQKPCGVQWYVTEWSACSRSCDGGYRVREIRCLADNITPSDRCDPKLTPDSREECNKQPCLAEITPSCSDQYSNCLVVVQARLCVYTYYKSVCCASCSRAEKPYVNTFQRNHVRR